MNTGHAVSMTYIDTLIRQWCNMIKWIITAHNKKEHCAQGKTFSKGILSYCITVSQVNYCYWPLRELSFWPGEGPSICGGTKIFWGLRGAVFIFIRSKGGPRGGDQNFFQEGGGPDFFCAFGATYHNQY